MDAAKSLVEGMQEHGILGLTGRPGEKSGIHEISMTLFLGREYMEPSGAISEADISPFSNCSRTGTLGEVYCTPLMRKLKLVTFFPRTISSLTSAPSSRSNLGRGGYKGRRSVSCRATGFGVILILGSASGEPAYRKIAMELVPKLGTTWIQ